jgi:Glycosyltransferase family 87
VSSRGSCGRCGRSVLGPPTAPLVAGAVLVLVAICLLPATARASVSEADAVRAANLDSKVLDQRAKNELLAPTANEVDGNWEVAYFADGEQVALVVVDPESGEVRESWTGYQVAWKMARGYSGSFGHALNAPYVFLPLCALFLLGLVDWRRPWRLANLDLLVLLGFGVSHFFFNRAEIGVSVPLQYPVLLYLLGRALWIGFRGGGEGVRPAWPAAWLLVAALFLVGVRVGLNVADSGAIDVGYASVVGADRIGDGEPIYDNFPEDVSQGDTYGPVTYLAYVPTELVWPWSGRWDDLPAAHGAAVLFDLATFLLLILLGLRIRPGPAGRRLAATLAFGWAAYPYTAFVLESNSNDTLVGALLVATLLVLARPAARGALLALATWAKFAPALLGPMLLTYESKRRPALLFAAGFGALTAAALLWPAIDPGLATFYERTIEYQSDRDSPFSILGQTSLEPLRMAILAATAVLSVALAFRPRRKSLVQVAALGAALLIALQLTMQHWFYLYVVWFYPLLLVALTATAAERGPSPARTSPPAPAR